MCFACCRPSSQSIYFKNRSILLPHSAVLCSYFTVSYGVNCANFRLNYGFRCFLILRGKLLSRFYCDGATYWFSECVKQTGWQCVKNQMQRWENTIWGNPVHNKRMCKMLAGRVCVCVRVLWCCSHLLILHLFPFIIPHPPSVSSSCQNYFSPLKRSLRVQLP